MFKLYLLSIFCVFSLFSNSVLSCEHQEPRKLERHDYLDWMSRHNLEPYFDEAARGNRYYLGELIKAAPEIMKYPLFGGYYFAIEQANKTDGLYDLAFFVDAYGKDGSFLIEIDSILRVKKLVEIVDSLLQTHGSNTPTADWLNTISAALQMHLADLRLNNSGWRAKFPLGLNVNEPSSNEIPSVVEGETDAIIQPEEIVVPLAIVSSDGNEETNPQLQEEEDLVDEFILVDAAETVEPAGIFSHIVTSIWNTLWTPHDLTGK